MKSKNFSWVLILVGTVFFTEITGAQSETPAGKFGYQISFPTGEPGDLFAPHTHGNYFSDVADINGDGKEEVILTGRAGYDQNLGWNEEIRIYFNNTPDVNVASPTFTLGTLISHPYPPSEFKKRFSPPFYEKRLFSSLGTPVPNLDNRFHGVLQV